jgi:hypothetical protein
VVFGINADRDTVPDLQVLAEGIEDSLDSLLALAGTAVAIRPGRSHADVPSA